MSFVLVEGGEISETRGREDKSCPWLERKTAKGRPLTTNTGCSAVVAECRTQDLRRRMELGGWVSCCSRCCEFLYEAHPIGTGFAKEMPSREKKRIGPRQKREAEAKPSWRKFNNSIRRSLTNMWRRSMPYSLNYNIWHERRRKPPEKILSQLRLGLWRRSWQKKISK